MISGSLALFSPTQIFPGSLSSYPSAMERDIISYLSDQRRKDSSTSEVSLGILREDEDEFHLQTCLCRVREILCSNSGVYVILDLCGNLILRS